MRHQYLHVWLDALNNFLGDGNLLDCKHQLRTRFGMARAQQNKSQWVTLTREEMEIVKNAPDEQAAIDAIIGSSPEDDSEETLHKSLNEASETHQQSSAEPLTAATSEPSEALSEVQAPASLQEPSQDKQETSKGIEDYVSPDTTGFSCVYKTRYTDFLVNEISLDGTVLHLESTRPANSKQKQDQGNGEHGTHPVAGAKRTLDPEEDGPVAKRNKVEQPSGAEADNAASGLVQASAHIKEISDVDQGELQLIFGQSVTGAILKLNRTILANPQLKAKDHEDVRSEIIESKADRTQAHSLIRRIFESRLESLTLQNEPGRMSIRAAPRSQTGQDKQETNTARSDGRRKGPGWQELGGDYLHFTLYKENKDTMEVLHFIASQLKLKVSAFAFAGTKDRRGVTVQRVSAYRVHKERIIGLRKRAMGWRVDGFEYKKQGLELGGLKGNEFVITLRDCRLVAPNPQTVDEQFTSIQQRAQHAADELAKYGFVNFYGLQRFGSYSTGTDKIGSLMLQGRLEEAVDSILSYDKKLLSSSTSEIEKVPRNDLDRAKAISIWQTTGDSRKATDLMPRRFNAENAIIAHLGRRHGDNRQDRDYQGALMSIQRGLRLMYGHAYQSLVWNKMAVRRSRMGTKVFAGDLVIVGDKNAAPMADQVDQDGEEVVHPGEEDSAEADHFVRARPLSQAEVESGKYDIFDIVLPLPGWDILYPQNLVKEYEKLMAEDKLNPHQMRRAWKDISLSGSYRKLMARPLNGVDIRAARCTGVQQLVHTDADRLAREPTAIADGETGNDIAVIVKLQLASSQYATMALRELTKGLAVPYKPDFHMDR